MFRFVYVKHWVKINKNVMQNTKPWFTDEIKLLTVEKRRAYLQLRSQTITYDEYKEVRNRVNAAIHKIKRVSCKKYSMETGSVRRPKKNMEYGTANDLLINRYKPKQ